MACYEYQVNDRLRDDPEVNKAFWNEAKAGLDSGKDIDAVVKDLAARAQVTPDTVAKILTSPKRGLYSLTNEMWQKHAQYQRTLAHAKQIISEANKSTVGKAIAAGWELPRRAVTVGHGGVIPFTHARDIAFVDPRAFSAAVRRAYSYSTRGAGAARWSADMAALKARPLYNFADRAGLDIRAESEAAGIVVGHAKNWTARSFDALKPLRLDLFEKLWRNTPREMKSLEYAKALATDLNHATGTIKGFKSDVARTATSRLMFAPKLRFAKLASAFVDPLKAVIKGGRATPAERYAAGVAAKRWAKIVGVNVAMLAINQAYNQAMGSDDKINWTDPTKSDWMRMKIHGFTVPGSPLFETAKLAPRAIAEAIAPQKKVRGMTIDPDRTKTLRQFAVGSLSPQAELVRESLTGRTFLGRRAAFPGLKQLIHGEEPERQPRESAAETGSRYLPIPLQPLQALVTEGTPAPAAKDFVHAAVEAGASGMVGEHVYQQKTPQKVSKPQQEQNTQFKWY